MSSCPRCGVEASFIDDYQRWYCYGCQEYLPVDPPSAEAEQAIASPASDARICKFCGKEGIHVPRFDAYFCHHCMRYITGPGQQEVNISISDGSEPTMVPMDVSRWNRYGFKIGKDGLTLYEREWISGKIDRNSPKPCRTVITEEGMDAMTFASNTSVSVGAFVRIPLKSDSEVYISPKWSDIIDYKVVGQGHTERFVFSTYNNFYVIKPLGTNTLETARNAKEIKTASHRLYEAVGIRHPKGPGPKRNYSVPFSRYFMEMFNEHARRGTIRRIENFMPPACEKHRKTGKFDPDMGRFYCKRCKDFIG